MGSALFKHTDEPGHCEEIRQIMECFAHVPRVSRCLLTQTFVGVMMQAVAAAYEDISKRLDESLHISDKGVAFDDFDASHGLEDDETNLNAFHTILTFNWAIECLESFKENILDVEKKCNAIADAMDMDMNFARFPFSPSHSSLTKGHRREIYGAQSFDRSARMLSGPSSNVEKPCSKPLSTMSRDDSRR